MGIHRSALQRRRRNDAKITKARNSIVKTKERSRRDARMTEAVKASDPPYAPAVTSWLCAKLGKQARQITSEDIKSLTT